MNTKLGNVQETMLIPLAIKANETMRPNARIQDKRAVEMAEELGFDLTMFDKFMSHEGVVARTIMFDEALKGYMEEYPDAACVNLGCGLDSRFERVDNGKILWYDIDLPDVIEVRKRFFKEQGRVSMIAESVLDPGWTERVEKRQKTIFVAEGILMYFSKEQVSRLLTVIANHFPDFVLLAELMPPEAAKGSKHHDTVKHTKATFGWGTRSGKELEALCPRLRLVRENSFNDVMKKYTVRGRLFAALPKIRDFNDRLAVFEGRQ